MSHVRPGLLGHCDRFVGPGATPLESIGSIGSIGCGVAGVVFAPRLRRIAGPRPTGATAAVSTLAVQIMAADLWGGVWCNTTPAAARWYHRPGQDAAEHLRFSAAHAVPPVSSTKLLAGHAGGAAVLPRDPLLIQAPGTGRASGLGSSP